MIVPGNRFEYLEARAALDAIDDGELDPETFRPGRSTCSPSISSASPARRRSTRPSCSPKSARPRLMRPGTRDFDEVLNFIATGGYSLKAYDRFRRLVRDPDGRWRIARPRSPSSTG
jgi:ATP-dependent helicase Lhr and Lhr-like helicase